MSAYVNVRWENQKWRWEADDARAEARLLARLLEQDRLEFEARLHEEFEPVEVMALEAGTIRPTLTRGFRCPCGVRVQTETTFYSHLRSAGCDGATR